MRLILAFLVLSGAIQASPVLGGDCNSGTLDEYIALGSTGCTFGGYTWGGFSFSATYNGNPVDPSELSVTWGSLGFGIGLFGFNATLPSLLITGPDTFEIEWSWAVSSDDLVGSIGSALQFAQYVPFLDLVEEACRGAAFTPDCATGAILLPEDGAWYDTGFGPAGTVGFRTYAARLTSPGSLDAEWPLTIKGGFAPAEVPEPGACVLLATGLGLIAARKRRQASR